MKTTYGLFICLILLLASSCSKDTEDKLSGKWQLKQVESGGSIIPVDTVWYNFQNTLFSYQLYDKTSNTYLQEYGFNTITDTQLTLEFADSVFGKNFIPHTDWEEIRKVFLITKLKGSDMVLTDEAGKIYVFRKF